MNLRRKCYSQGRDGSTTPNGTDRPNHRQPSTKTPMCLVLSPLEAPHDKPLQRELNFWGHFVVVVAVLLTYWHQGNQGGFWSFNLGQACI